MQHLAVRHHLLVDMPHKRKGSSEAHSTKHEEEGVAHHEHVTEEEGCLHEA